MSLAVLYVDDRGEPAIDAYAVMESAIDLFFKTNDPNDLDVTKVAEGIGKAHTSLLSVAAKLLARHPDAESLRPRTSNISSVADNVIQADFTPPARRQPQTTLPVAPEVVVREQALPELPLELPFQSAPKTEPVQLLRPSAKGRPKKQAPVLPGIAPAGKVVTLKRRRTDAEPRAPKLPRRLSRVEDALRNDVIICLEDGKAVVDLGKHLSGLGMTPAEYLKKWNLPESYPMKAPGFIQKHGVTYEYDASRDRMIRV
jgi:hypothetical protein|nr:MucR family transcriptional regulator [Neorhizobium tomejilense]